MVEMPYSKLEDGKPYLIYGRNRFSRKYVHIFVFKPYEKFSMKSYYRSFCGENYRVKSRSEMGEYSFGIDHISNKNFIIFELSEDEFNYHTIGENI